MLKNLGNCFSLFRNYSYLNPSLSSILMERRSIRDYSDRDVPNEIIEEIIEMGNWAPSAKNMQPLKYYVCSSPTLLKDISDQCMISLKPSGDLHDKKLPNIFFNAPVTIFISWHEGAKNYEEIDVGLAMQNMQLYAHSLGLGSCCIGYSKYGSEFIKEVFGMEEEEVYSCALTLGYPNTERNVNAPKRREANMKYFDDDDL